MNTFGPTYVVQPAYLRMPQGSITATSGSLRFRPCPATSMRIVMLMAVVALALALAPMRVKAITRGLIDTPVLHTASEEARDSFVQNRTATLLPAISK